MKGFPYDLQFLISDQKRKPRKNKGTARVGIFLHNLYKPDEIEHLLSKDRESGRAGMKGFS
jgi:hypothetical protein